MFQYFSMMKILKYQITQSCLIFASPWIVAHQAPSVKGFSGKRAAISSSKGFPTLGSNFHLLCLTALQEILYSLSHQGNLSIIHRILNTYDTLDFVYIYLGLEGAFKRLSGKESTCQARDVGLIPAWKIPWRKEITAHSSIISQKILWTEGAWWQSMGLQSQTQQRLNTHSCTY